MRFLSLILPAVLAAGVPAGSVAAHTSGFANGTVNGGVGMGGPGMLTVADDGSVLVTQMQAAGSMGGGMATAIDRELVRVAPDGTERWRVSFDDGFPMMAVTRDDLVVLTLREDWWVGTGTTGDMGSGHGSGPGSGHQGQAGDAHADTVILVALDLETGAERWRSEIAGGMGMLPQFSPDGSRIYLTVRDLAAADGFGDGPMHQGDAPSGAMLMSTTVVAVDSSTGATLWSFDLAGSQ